MSEVLGLRANEEVLIITNFEGETMEIAKALYDQTIVQGGRPTLMVQPTKTSLEFAENSVLAAIASAPDIVISISAYKLGKDPYGLHIGYVGKDGKKYDHIYHKLMEGDRKLRGFWSPSLTKETFQRCVAIDYRSMRETAAKLKKILDQGRKVRVTSPGGTDLMFSIDGRQAKLDDGDLCAPGAGGNIPCGEVYISPAVATTDGKIVYDGTLDLITKCVQPNAPVRIVFKNGYVDSVTGGEDADALLKVIELGETKARTAGLKAEERNARHLGEMGIGLNFSARMCNNMLEDEKVGRTVHFAIGANYDNDANALIHQDCLVLSPTIWVDDQMIMRDGDLQI
jgi:aminopeptidase